MTESSAGDPFDLARFVEAQQGVHERALAELQAGEKKTHWMWFIFPQLRGLGHSSMAERYGIASLEEAKAYLADPVLGPRLALCVEAVRGSAAPSLRALFGKPDDVKILSSLTLFALASTEQHNPFRQALDRWKGGALDGRTLALLGRE